MSAAAAGEGGCRGGRGLQRNGPWAAGGLGKPDLTEGPRSVPTQALTVFQRSLTAMQIQVAGLLQFAVPMFPTAEVRQSPQHPRREWWGAPGARTSEIQAVGSVLSSESGSFVRL